MTLRYYVFAIATTFSSCVWGTHPAKHLAITTDTYKIFKEHVADVFKLTNLSEIDDMIIAAGLETTSIAHHYVFHGNKFESDDNFLDTPFGIRLFYNEPDIKPCVAITTDLFIAYDKIKSLLLPNTVAAQYIK